MTRHAMVCTALVLVLVAMSTQSCSNPDEGPLGIGVTFKEGPGLPVDVASLTITVTPYASTASSCRPGAGPVQGVFPVGEMTDLDMNGYREAVLHDLPFGCPLYVEVQAMDASSVQRYSGRADGITLIEGERRFVEMDLTPDGAISLMGSTLTEPAFGLTATALAETDGRVLVTGGFSIVSATTCPAPDYTAPEYHCFSLTATDKAYVFDQGSASARPVAAGNLTVPRALHSATLLADGRVLIAGGVQNAVMIIRDKTGVPTWGGYEIVDIEPATGTVLNTYELFDPVTTTDLMDPERDGDLTRGSFEGAPTFRHNFARYGHTASLVRSDASSVDGYRVLLAGGMGTSGLSDTSTPKTVDGFTMDFTTGVHDFVSGTPTSGALHAAPAAAFADGSVWLFGGSQWPGSDAGITDPDQAIVEEWKPQNDALEWTTGPVTFNGFATEDHPELVRMFAKAQRLGAGENIVAVTGWYGARCADVAGVPTPTYEYLESDGTTPIPTFICPPEVAPDFTLTVDVDPEVLVADTDTTTTAHALAEAIRLENGTRAGQVVIIGGIEDVDFTTTDVVDVYTGADASGLLQHDASLGLALNNERALCAAAEMNGGNVVILGGVQFDLATNTLTVLDTIEYLNW